MAAAVALEELRAGFAEKKRATEKAETKAKDFTQRTQRKD